MSDINALGDAVGRATIARTIEPAATGVGADGQTHEANCLNCGAPLTGNFCSACGQHAHVHRTVRAFFHDLVHGVFHFEGRTWRTLPLLAFHPGQLTRQYIDGKRASFVSPMAIFLFTVFLMFAALSNSMSAPHVDQSVGKSLAEAEKNQVQLIDRLKTQRATALATGTPVQTLDARIASESSDLKVIEAMPTRKLNSKVSGLDGLPGWLGLAIARARANPDLALYKMRNTAYKYSWALIPISVPFLWLLFPFSRRFRMYDHIVFVTYSISFMMMLVIGGSLLAMAGVGGIVGLLALVPPVHLYVQLRDTYGLTLFGALWRTVALTSFAFVAVVIFALAMVALGVLD